LLTVLGEFVLPGGGTAWTGDLLRALRVLGLEEKTARQAIARTASRGWLEPERIGRRARWHLSEAGAKLLTEGTKRIYAFGREQRHWDGQWVLILASVPETKRDLRYRMRVRLGWAGFAPFAPGAWISPWTERQEEAVRVLNELHVMADAVSFVGGIGVLGDPKALVAEAWDLADLDQHYVDFVHSYQSMRPRTDEEYFCALTKLVHDWRRFPTIDPGLPAQLLPGSWKGQEAAELFHQLHDRWRSTAQAWWQAGTAVTDRGITVS
jgi:phenylacetic acid degradation operon negative regulatory protein